MAATLATVAAISKELYEPRLRKQLNDDTVTIKRILKTSDGVAVECAVLSGGLQSRRKNLL